MPMKKRISALMDGELEVHEMTETLHALRDADADALRTDIAAYQLIGDALRGEPNLGMDVSARVMAAIEHEPAIVLLTSRREVHWQRPALALAASAAGVALVAWLALTPVTGGNAPGLVAGAVPGEDYRPGAVVMASDTDSRLRMQEYLVAHQVYAPGGAIAGGTNPVRTASIAYEGR